MSYGYIRERVEPEEELPKPQVTPLADVTIVLLVIFLTAATATMMSVEVKLPEAENTAVRDINLATNVTVALMYGCEKDPEVYQPDPGRCPKCGKALTRGPKYFFEDDKTPIEAKNVWVALRDIKGPNLWHMAVIKADKETPCQHINVLVQCLQGLGVDEICFQMAMEEETPEKKI